MRLPSEAARLTRSSLGLSPDKPIGRLINALEQAGVMIIRYHYFLSKSMHSHFGLGPTTQTRNCAMTAGWPNDRMRFNIAHELGHLVLHSSAPGSRQEVEDEAYQFAGEFLLPENQIREEMVPPIKLSDLAELKLRWGVAMAALIVRADRLNIITKRQYKYLFQQLGMRGWRKQEPANLEPPLEKPRLLCQLLEMCHGLPLNIKRISNDVHLPTQLVEQILNNYLGKEGHNEKVAFERKVLSFPNTLKKT